MGVVLCVRWDLSVWSKDNAVLQEVIDEIWERNDLIGGDSDPPEKPNIRENPYGNSGELMFNCWFSWNPNDKEFEHALGDYLYEKIEETGLGHYRLEEWNHWA